MPGHGDIVGLEEVIRPAPTTPEQRHRASLAVAWQVELGKATHEQAKTMLQMLGLVDDVEAAPQDRLPSAAAQARRRSAGRAKTEKREGAA